MLLRLPFLLAGALGLPVMVALSLGLALAQWRVGEPVEPLLPVLAVVGLVMCAWLRSARERTDASARGLLARTARLAPWLMLPGAVVGVVIAVVVHLDYVGREEGERDDLARGVCHDLRLDDPRCAGAASACLPRPIDRPIEPEAHRACIEGRLR